MSNANLTTLFPSVNLSNEGDVRGLLESLVMKLGEIVTCPFTPGNVALNADNPAWITVEKDGNVVLCSEAAAFIAANLFGENLPSAPAPETAEALRETLQTLVTEREQREAHERQLDEIHRFVATVDGYIMGRDLKLTVDERNGAIIRMLTMRGFTTAEMTDYNTRLATAEANDAARREGLVAGVTAKVASMTVGEDADKTVLNDANFAQRVENAVNEDPTLGPEAWALYMEALTTPDAPVVESETALEARPDNPNAATLQAQDEGGDKPADPAPQPDATDEPAAEEGAGLQAPGEGEADPNAAPEPQPDAPQDQEARDAGAAEVPGAVIQAAKETSGQSEQRGEQQ